MHQQILEVFALPKSSAIVDTRKGHTAVAVAIKHTTPLLHKVIQLFYCLADTGA